MQLCEVWACGCGRTGDEGGGGGVLQRGVAGGEACVVGAEEVRALALPVAGGVLDELAVGIPRSRVPASGGSIRRLQKQQQHGATHCPKVPPLEKR